jgi:hypothetical protein
MQLAIGMIFIECSPAKHGHSLPRIQMVTDIAQYTLLVTK